MRSRPRFCHPGFAPLSRWLGEYAAGDFDAAETGGTVAVPTPECLNAMSDALRSGIDRRPDTANGMPIRFVSADSRFTDSRPSGSRPSSSRPSNSRPSNSRPSNSRPSNSRPAGALGYETSILETGRVPLRPDDWHDAFNALTWIAYPEFKRTVNALHVAHRASTSGNARGPIRDALTLLDESGVIVLCADPGLGALHCARRWRDLFWDNRRAVDEKLRFQVCGHALLDKLRQPYPSMTGRALIVYAPLELFGQSHDNQRRYADHAAAAALAGLSSTAATVPLPLAGIPGWASGNDCAAFYDDASVFRPAHASIATSRSATVSQSACAPASTSSSAVP